MGATPKTTPIGEDGDARVKWVERVLGVKVPGRAGAAGVAAAPGWAAARQGWQAASEAVDRQIANLQAVLRQSGDDRLEEIAEFGLNGLTGNHKVPLMALLVALGEGDPARLQKAGPKALNLIDAFRKHLQGSEEVEVCDGNPFGIPVAIRATLLPALARLAAALQAAVKS
jgi:hypothetical protein